MINPYRLGNIIGRPEETLNIQITLTTHKDQMALKLT
jgi:hypothetical protein